MNELDFNTVRDSDHLVYEVVSGSRAYGLDTADSDLDIKGVFIIPQTDFFASDFPEQLQDERNDVVYYELGKFFRLLAKSNPNILEVVATPSDFVRKKHAGIGTLDMGRILSKQCCDTFGGYALSQIRKARGVKNRINSHFDKERKTPLGFCHVVDNESVVTLDSYLMSNDLVAHNCSLSTIGDFENLYRLHAGGRGILDDDSQTQLKIREQSDFPVLALVYFDRKNFSAYYKEHKGYWEWKVNRMRNELTLESEMYDTKNMMHAFRLLHMALDIARKGELILQRPDREFLLEVRYGKFEFEDMVRLAEEKLDEVNNAFASSELRAAPDVDYLREKLIEIRTERYNSTS